MGPARTTRRFGPAPTFLAGFALAFARSAAGQNPIGLVSVATYGNFHTAGVIATVSGDAPERNGAASLEWRRTGDPAYLPGHPLARIDATHFVGSLFWLTPGTSYDVRVSLSDPDGGGGVGNGTVSTRVDALPEPTVRTLYVAPNGDDAVSNPGTNPAAPLKTIQRAANLAVAGDLVVIRAGVYREAVTVPASGSALQPIVFRGDPGAILDGADERIAAGLDGFAPSGTFPGLHVRALGFGTGHVVSESGRLFPYGSPAALQALAAGAPGGWHFDAGTQTLYVKFADGQPPSAHTLHVARRGAGFTIDGRSFVRVENVEIRHYGADEFGKGVYLRYTADCAVRGSVIHDVGAAGVWVKGGDRSLIEDSEFRDTSIFGWKWDLVKGSTAENDGVVFTDDLGRGHVVRRNVFDGTFNGIGPCGALGVPPPGGGITSEIDVHDNRLSRHTDDAFEPEGWCSNVRIFRNETRDVHMAFAVAPANPGPTWFLRNVALDTGNTRTSRTDGWTSSVLKINSGYAPAVGPLFLYHNTARTLAPATNAMVLLNPGNSTFVRSRNNLWAGTDRALDKVNGVTLDFDYDDLFTTAPGRLVNWLGTPYDTLGAFQAAIHQEENGRSSDPLLVDPYGGDPAPGPTSPLVDGGVALAGVNDGPLGANPDIGAIETGRRTSAANRFFPVTPCRVVDTRNPRGGRGGPALAATSSRRFGVAGLCGVPADARAVSANVTVTGNGASGQLVLHPGDGAEPVASTLAFTAGKTRANNALLFLSADGFGAVSVANRSGAETHFILDVNGYFR